MSADDPTPEEILAERERQLVEVFGWPPDQAADAVRRGFNPADPTAKLASEEDCKAALRRLLARRDGGDSPVLTRILTALVVRRPS